MPSFKLPLSGDVTQSINPWNWFWRSVGGQFGFININLGKSADPDLESQILEDVGSYGRQLGQIGDALDVLIRYVQPKDLSAKDAQALKALTYHLDEIKRLKLRRGSDHAQAVVRT